MGRQFIAIGGKGVINGIIVVAKSTVSVPGIKRKYNYPSPCSYCCFKKCVITSDSRPACFANDPENLDKRSIYYVEV